MGRAWASAVVSAGLGCARPGHVRPTGGQSSERVGAPEAHQQAMVRAVASELAHAVCLNIFLVPFLSVRETGV